MHVRRSTFTSLALCATLAVSGGLIVAGCGSSDDSSSKTKEPPVMTGSNSTTESTDTTTTSDDSSSSDSGEKPDGATLFAANCESCHGKMGTGGHVGPDLQKSKMSDDQAAVVKQISEGGGQMPAFSGILSDEEIDAIATYVHKDLAPKS